MSARLNGLREKDETAISCRLQQRRKIYISTREEDGVATNMCPCRITMESRAYIIGEREVYKRERDALEVGMKK